MGAFVLCLSSALLLAGLTFIVDEVNADTSKFPGIKPPNLKPEQYRLQFRNPKNCEPGTGKCDTFVGISTNKGNDGFLDIYLEGHYAGWVAVGFSKTANMFSADVVVCNKVPLNNSIVVLDTWNPPAFDRANLLDPTQDVEMFSSGYTNGSITCSVTKRIAATDRNYDLYLDDSYYVIFGGSPHDSDNATHIKIHSVGDEFGNELPTVTDHMYNPVLDRGEGQFSVNIRPKLIRLHGILMIIAWPTLAMTGIYFTAWMRPALPGGQWFQVHRALMIISLIVTLSGLIPAFVAFKDNATTGLIDFGRPNVLGTIHFLLGFVAILLHIANPIIALFRCHPGDKNRWIFNVVHGRTLGLITNIVAMVNVGIGLFLFCNIPYGNTGYIPFFIYNGHQGFWIAMLVVLIGLFYVYPYFTKSGSISVTAAYATNTEKIPLTASEGSISDEPPSIANNKALRWGCFVLFMTAMALTNVAVIILVAL